MFWIIIVYGIFCIAGGLIGFFKADSLPSLLAGGIGGLILIVCGIGMWKKNRIAGWLALIIALFFGFRFLSKLVVDFQVMPHLIMTILSIVAIIAALVFLSANAKGKIGH